MIDRISLRPTGVTFEHKVMRKREAFRGQATHTAEGKLYKFVNGQLFVLTECMFCGSSLGYPVWSKCANHQKPANITPLNKENLK